MVLTDGHLPFSSLWMQTSESMLIRWVMYVNL